MLYIHGGPGYVSIPMSWWFSRGLEEYFTVIQWDQRATGKTYLLTDPAKVAPTLTPERMIADTEEMATWARKEFGKDKIFVLGHSWGSFLGLQPRGASPRMAVRLYRRLPADRRTRERASRLALRYGRCAPRG